MATKKAAELKRGDVVTIGSEQRVVRGIDFTERPIDSAGTTGIHVYWADRPRPSIVAADKDMTVE